MWPQKCKWLNSCSRYDARMPFILEKNLNNINVQTKSAHFGNCIIYTKTEEISFTWPSSHCLIECSLICCLHTWWAASSQLGVVRVGPRETGGGGPGRSEGVWWRTKHQNNMLLRGDFRSYGEKILEPVWLSMCLQGLTAPGAAPFYEYYTRSRMPGVRKSQEYFGTFSGVAFHLSALSSGSSLTQRTSVCRVLGLPSSTNSVLVRD